MVGEAFAVSDKHLSWPVNVKKVFVRHILGRIGHLMAESPTVSAF